MTEGSASINLDAAAILALDLEGIKLIEASAGTGKTHAITDLYLRHILAGRSPSQILVVTYTNAATEELRGRIRQRLYQALDLLLHAGSCEDRLLMLLADQSKALDEAARVTQITRLQLALRSMDEAAISTIHSFCQRSLKQHALSGYQLFDSELLADDRRIWESAIKDWWRKTTYDLDREAWQLMHRSLPDLEGLIAALLELRNKPYARILPDARDSLASLLDQPRKIARSLHRLAPLWQQQRRAIGEILTTSPALRRTLQLPYHPDNLATFLQAADEFFGAQEPAGLFADFQYLGTNFLHRNSKPSRQGQDPALEHEFFRKVNAIARDWVRLVDTLGPRLRADAFYYASQTVRTTKREMTALAFQDQLTLLLEALESDNGKALAENLRRQYPVAMIDEFQDTDAIQYQIFNHIYLTANEVSLTLIGDPKQAIYSFRGGDIFTYMQVRHLPGIQLFELQTNWRSQPALVDAVNTLFSHRPDAFIYRDSIGFSPAASVSQNASYALRLGSHTAVPMTLWQLPLDQQQRNHSRQTMRDLINEAIAGEITGLLENPAGKVATIDGRSLQSGDIAILVRQASEGQALSQVLARHGIRCVTIGRDSVFRSDEARGLYDLLLAISQYRDQSLASLSLASNLLNLDYRQIAAIVDNDPAWQRWLEDLGHLHQLWERHGFIAMFQSLLHRFEITRSLAQKDNRERRITNLLHLAELLQQQSAVSAGISPMTSWLHEQFEEDAGEDAELRLEDDEHLVKIVTVHKSKGLQYPVVFVPFLWTCKQVDRSRAVYFHDAAMTPCIDLGSEDLERHWLVAEKERLAEDLRLLYVALTRARSKVYLAWGTAGGAGNSGHAKQTALAYLLHSRQTPDDLESCAADGFPADIDFTADLQALVDRSRASIEVVALPQATLAPGLHTADAPRQPIELARFTRSGMTPWRVNSFSGLTRDIHQPTSPVNRCGEGDPVLDFPAGSHVGLLIHSLLENLDFQQDIGQQCTRLLPRFLPRSGLAIDYESTLVRWLENIIRAPIAENGLALVELANEHRLNELSFDFALDHLDIDRLNRFLQSLSSEPLKPVSSTEFGGLITGVIDLVFIHRGRYYFADYKSNLLGARLQDYVPAQLQHAMLERRYDLQSLIYSVALNRFLRQRLVDYDYEQHFGGAYYLFLRGLRPEHGHRYGVHFDRPAAQTIRMLDQLMKFTVPEGSRA